MNNKPKFKKGDVVKYTPADNTRDSIKLYVKESNPEGNYFVGIIESAEFSTQMKSFAYLFNPPMPGFEDIRFNEYNLELVSSLNPEYYEESQNT